MLGLAVLHGHDPRDVREWPYRDLEVLVMTFNDLYGGD